LTVLIDSSAWIEYFRGSELSEEIELIIFSGEEIVASAVNVAEVYRYLLNQTPDKAEPCIKFLFQCSFVLPVTVQIALETAKLRQKRNLSLGDAFIMATSRLHGAKILTCDADFKKEPDVIYLSTK